MRLVWILFITIAPFGARTADFSVELRVANAPQGFAVMRTRVDFTALLKPLGVALPIDERTLRLEGPDGKEIPIQFSADPQTRPTKRALLGGSPDKVSYAAEYAVSNAPSDLKVSGELAWIGSATNVVLKFSTPSSGRIAQTPFPPQNFRMFDANGKATPVRLFPSMRLTPQWPKDGVIHFFEDQTLVTSYFLGADGKSRRPHFYPVNGPDNISLTEFGKPHDPTGSHAHHYSLWITHHDVNGISFWGERGGIIAHEALDLMEDGPIFSRIVQRLNWNNGEQRILRETRTITMFRAAGDFRAMDIEMTLAPASSNAVTFGKTSFGFLAARVAQSMTVFDGGGEIRTSRGNLNESQVHLTRAEWLDQSGPIAPNKWGGLAILDSPENPHFPTGWHCRDDGWAGAAFNMDEPFVLEAGKTLRLKHRIILHRGNAEEARIQDRFAEWAARPAIAIGLAKRE